jgi:Family of unknown function (DUF6290)
MAVTSIRLNTKEQKLLNFLKEYYHCDSSTILKKSIIDMYEDLKDKELIETYEKEESENKTKFKKYEDLVKTSRKPSPNSR